MLLIDHGEFDEGDGCQLLTELLQYDHALQQGAMISSGHEGGQRNQKSDMTLIMRALSHSVETLNRNEVGLMKPSALVHIGFIETAFNQYTLL